MSRRYDMGEQDTSATHAVSNRRKVTVKVCMLDDSVVKFDIEVSAYALTAMKVYHKARNVHIIFMLSIFVGVSSVLKVLKFSDVLRSPQ